MTMNTVDQIVVDCETGVIRYLDKTGNDVEPPVPELLSLSHLDADNGG